MHVVEDFARITGQRLDPIEDQGQRRPKQLLKNGLVEFA